MNKKIELTSGPIGRNLFFFCLPIFVGLIFQNLYNSVDSIVIGQFVGSSPLAAVTVCGNIANLFVGFFMGMSTGASVLFARYYSQRKYKELSNSIHTTMAFTIIFGIILTVIALLCSNLLLHLLNCPADVFTDAQKYLNIYLLGLTFTGVYNIGSAILRSYGNSQSPFYYLVTASILNIILDVLLVTVVQMGVIGVAVATIISQGVSAVLTWYRLTKQEEGYQLSWKKLHIDPKMLKEVMTLGLPAGIQTILMSISGMFTQTYVNSFGSYCMAGIGSAMKIDMFANMSAQSLGLGITTFVSQNLAVGKIQRLRDGIKVASIACAVIVGLTSIPIYIYASVLMSVFSRDPNVITAGNGMLRTIMPFYEIMGFMNLGSGIVRGYGKSLQVMYFTLFGMVIFRQAYLAIALSISHNIQLIYWNYPICWAITATITYLYYLKKCRPAYSQSETVCDD